MTNRITIGLISFLVFATASYAQIGIGTTTPNSTLDVRGSLSLNYRAFTASTSAGTDNTLVFTGTLAATVTLPDATTCAGRVYYIKNASATVPAPVLTIATVSSQTIDGLSSWTIDEPNEVVSVVSNGTNWYVPTQDVPVGKTATTGGSWNQGGNRVTAAKSIGTITNFDFPFITNNTEKMRVAATGNVAIGATSFNATYPEKLLVFTGSTGSVNAIVGKGTCPTYLQLNIQNLSNGTGASSDVVATNNIGDESGNFIDMGINSSTNTSSGILGGFSTAYLQSTGGDLVIGNAASGKNLILFTNGGTATERMRITSTGNVGIGTGSTVAATLDVSGTYKLGTAGTALTNMIKTNFNINDAVAFDYTATRQITVTVTGATANATVLINPRTALPAGLGIGWARVSSTNNVTIGFTNTSTAPTAVGNITFDVTIIQ